MKHRGVFLCLSLIAIIGFSTAALAQTADDWYNLGYDCMMSGEYEEAVENFTKAIEADPTPVYFYDDRGRAYANLGRYDEAIADYKKAIEIDPDYIFPYGGLAFAYYDNGDLENALESFTVALDIDPMDSSYNARADVYRQLGRFDEALADIEEALALDGNNPQWIYTRGLIYRDMGEMEKAKADLGYACDESMSEACDALENMK